MILHTLLIRYSLFSEDLKAWKISRTDLESYRKQLFDEDRLNERFEMFKNITLPSLLNQKDINEKIGETNLNKIQVFIATSESLPIEHKKNLEQLVKDYSWVTIKYLPSKKANISSIVESYIDEAYEELGQPILFSSTRLDDDDLLSKNFYTELETYTVNENTGRVISFSQGYWGLYDTGKNIFTHICERFSPKIALGMALINERNGNGYAYKSKTIYELGNHTQVDRKVPVILDARKPMFIRTMHQQADTHSSDRIRKTLANSRHIHPLDAMKQLGVMFPFIFNGSRFVIDEIELQTINFYNLKVKNKYLSSNFTVKAYLYEKKILVQLSGYKPKNCSMSVFIKYGNSVLPETLVFDDLATQGIIHLSESSAQLLANPDEVVSLDINVKLN